MKKSQNRKYLLKEAVILLIVSILVFSNFFTSAQTIDNLSYNLQTNEQEQYEISDSSFSNGLKQIFLEGFENDIIPPYTEDFGYWKNTSISPLTWFIDDTSPGEGKYCATVKRGDYTGPMDEQLITPSLDFSHNDKVVMQFRWYTSRYAALSYNLMDLNVSISVDNEQSWTWLWNENDVSIQWISWRWYDCELDLTDYAKNEPDVRICFQFNSWDPTNDEGYQEYSIDAVRILVNSTTTTDFRCDCGPDEVVSWSYNDIENIKFEGRAFGGKPKYHDWEWDFGDDNWTKGQFPKHRYNDTGMFTVTLTVYDDDNIQAKDTKTIKVQEPKPTDIEVKIRRFSPLGIIFVIQNTGVLDLTDISWYIEVIWGAMGTNKDIITGKNISYLNSGKKKTIPAWGPFLFFVEGWIEVRVVYKPFNRDQDEEVRNGFKLGPLIFFYLQKKDSGSSLF